MSLPLSLTVWREAIPSSIREFLELQMSETPLQASFSSYLSLDLSSLLRGAPLSPWSFPLFLGSQAPGELQSRFGTVHTVILSGCEMLRANLGLCVCICVVCLCSQYCRVG